MTVYVLPKTNLEKSKKEFIEILKNARKNLASSNADEISSLSNEDRRKRRDVYLCFAVRNSLNEPLNKKGTIGEEVTEFIERQIVPFCAFDSWFDSKNGKVLEHKSYQFQLVRKKWLNQLIRDLEAHYGK